MIQSSTRVHARWDQTTLDWAKINVNERPWRATKRKWTITNESTQVKWSVTVPSVCKMISNEMYIDETKKTNTLSRKLTATRIVVTTSKWGGNNLVWRGERKEGGGGIINQCRCYNHCWWNSRPFNCRPFLSAGFVMLHSFDIHRHCKCSS